MQQRHLLSLRNPSVSDPIQSPSQIIRSTSPASSKHSVSSDACCLCPAKPFHNECNWDLSRAHKFICGRPLCDRPTRTDPCCDSVTAQLCDLRHGAASKQPLLETSHAIVCPLRGAQQCEQPQRSTFVIIRGYIGLTASNFAYSSSI